MVCRVAQILQSLIGSFLLGVTDGKATSVADILATNCAAQYSVVRMIEMLTSGGSVMSRLIIRAVTLHEP